MALTITTAPPSGFTLPGNVNRVPLAARCDTLMKGTKFVNAFIRSNNSADYVTNVGLPLEATSPQTMGISQVWNVLQPAVWRQTSPPSILVETAGFTWWWDPTVAGLRVTNGTSEAQAVAAIWATVPGTIPSIIINCIVVGV